MRRIATGLASAAVAVTVTMTATMPGLTTSAADAATAETGATYLVGRGVSDSTGEPAEAGMMGYADLAQNTAGLHMRPRSRAFVIADTRSGRRVVHVTADVGMIFQSVRDKVLARLGERFGSRYNEQNVMLTATHTHAGPGGYSHHTLYNITTLGYHEKTFNAIVDGIVDSIVEADADLAPATLTLSQSSLDNANVNRARAAFDRNPAADKAHFPNATDTLSTTLEVHRNGKLDGIINWFPVHGTSMSTDNRLISPDNKGYASYHWERQVRGVDYLDQQRPDFVASFAQSNAGDMSPNLNLAPGSGPTEDEFENTRIIGTRMFDAARSAGGNDPVSGGIDSRLVYVDMSDVAVRGEFTPDGKSAHTCDAAMGSQFAGGSTEDGGGGLPGLDQSNPLAAIVSGALYTASPELKACQAPKEILLPLGALDLVQQKLPVQLVRIGDFYLIGIPAEVTIVSGLRLRQAVAKIVGADLDHVLVQGYANAYAHYLTTPEEYEATQYEQASTIFGRNELPAFTQVSADLATSMKNGTTLPLGEKERDRTNEQLPTLQGNPIADAPPLGRSFGDVLSAPKAEYTKGQQVSVVFAGAHPNNNLRRRSTYLAVERKVDGQWVRVHDDGDWSTKFRWAREGLAASKVTITWDIPQDAATGLYRIRYFGDARGLLGGISSISGTTPLFTVD
ncbi:neutral/alkaline non-lysosomal ceramidase N-terminal domain-containing protein [Nocardioides sp. NPDC051685]|uniref:neutral/alkaline non-lysosomal ceramidase N-terminal domain-containing protein n=1 Tax=Nocardioides sp. NPDC051685 TaxID=3364334 RepID=UPI0037921215